MEIYKQQRGEYMGSLLTGWMEGMLPLMKADVDTDVQLGDEVFRERGLNNVVKDVDMDYPPEWRLARSNRKKGAVPAASASKAKPAAKKGKK
mgnify:CR=1 FL=1